MANKLFGVLLDVKEETCEAVEIEDTLENLYQILNCSMIEVTSRTIGGKRFNCICDEEGLFVNSPKISAINDLGEVQLVGNIFVVSNENIDGELQSLTQDEANYVMKYIRKMPTREHMNGYPMLTQVDY